MRNLDPELGIIQRRINRQYRAKIILYDVARPGSVLTIADVVSGNAENFPQEFLDITNRCRNVQVTSDGLTFVLEDPLGEFDPDTGEKAMFLVENQVIRVIEGDAQIDEDRWEPTFTGHIRGTVGFVLNRESRQREASIQCLDRSQNKAFNRMPLTTRAFSHGTDFGKIAEEIALVHMGLTPPEIGFPTIWGKNTCHSIVQIVELSAMESLKKVGEPFGRVPFFNGRGQLDFWQKRLNPAEGLDIGGRLTIPYDKVQEIRTPASGPKDTVNKVRVIGLDCRLSMVVGDFQRLASATITTGFFEKKSKVLVKYSEDDSVKALTGFDPLGLGAIAGFFDNADMVNGILDQVFGPDGPFGQLEPLFADTPISGFDQILKGIATIALPSFHVTKSVKDSILGFLFTEAWVPDKAPFGGTITVTGGGLEEGLIAMITSGLITAAEQPDFCPFAPGDCMPVGRVPEAVFLASILFLMIRIASGSYEIWGAPFDFCYREIEYIHVLDGAEFWEENELEIDNDFIDRWSWAEDLGMLELMWAQQNASPRIVAMQHSLYAEIGDVLKLPDGRVYTITNYSYDLDRGGQVSIPIVSYYTVRTSIEVPEPTSLDATFDGYIAVLTQKTFGAKARVRGDLDKTFQAKVTPAAGLDKTFTAKVKLIVTQEVTFDAKAMVGPIPVEVDKTFGVKTTVS